MRFLGAKYAFVAARTPMGELTALLRLQAVFKDLRGPISKGREWQRINWGGEWGGRGRGKGSGRGRAGKGGEERGGRGKEGRERKREGERG